MPHRPSLSSEIHLQLRNRIHVAAGVAAVALAAHGAPAAGIVFVKVAERVADAGAVGLGFEDLPEARDGAADGLGLDLDVEVEVGAREAEEAH